MLQSCTATAARRATSALTLIQFYAAELQQSGRMDAGASFSSACPQKRRILSASRAIKKSQRQCGAYVCARGVCLGMYPLGTMRHHCKLNHDQGGQCMLPSEHKRGRHMLCAVCCVLLAKNACRCAQTAK